MTQFTSLLMVLLMAAFPAFSQTQEESLGYELAKLAPEERAKVDEILQTLLDLEGTDGYYRKMGTRDESIRPFICLGGQAGLIATYVYLSCINTLGESFSLS